MPVRFACPHCRQKLSVTSRKAGREANCPRCQRLLTIPAIAPEPERLAPPAAEPEPILATATSGADQSETAPPADHTEPEAAQPVTAPPVEHRLQPYDEDPDDFELVFDTSDDDPAASPAQSHPDLIAVPRLVLYLQGGLLAVVALVSFALGL